MNPIDGAGNLLNEKDAVVVHCGNVVLKGQVVKIKEASVVMASGNEMRPGLPGYITINIPITIAFHPTAPNVLSVFKIVKPPNWDKPES